jgi:poly-gamma-glutamate synthesis protein (capsule biosynthesis protein)
MIKINYSCVSLPLIIFLALVTFIFFVYQLYFFVKIHALPSTDEVLLVVQNSVDEFNNNTERSSSILFLGDVMLGRNVEYLSDLHGVEYSTARIVDDLPPADAVVANFESAMAIPHVRTRSYTTQFSTTETMLPVLTALGVTHVSLANNHTMDFGKQGYENAVSKLSDISIATFGHSTLVSSSSITIIDGMRRVGIIGLNTVFVNPNMEQVREQIEYLNEVTDVQVAYVHWGDEYVEVHNNAQANFARTLVEMGIDVVVGHHPHVVQDIEEIDGGLVFYSLGNFIFDQYFSTEVQEGYMLLMTVRQDDELTFSIIPVTSIDARSQPRLMTASETAIFLEGLSARSDESIRDAILHNNLSIIANSVRNSLEQ